MKSMYKIITSLFLQKSLEAYHNSGIQPNEKFLKRVPYNGQFCKNRSLKLDKTSGQHTFVFKKYKKTGLDLLIYCIHEQNSVFYRFSFK